MTTDQIQKDITAYIEKTLFLLTAKVDVKQFEETIQQNVTQKRESATSTEDFYDRLMLNIAYKLFVIHMVWDKCRKLAI